MRTEFCAAVLQALARDGDVPPGATVVAVCGGEGDALVLDRTGAAWTALVNIDVGPGVASHDDAGRVDLAHDSAAVAFDVGRRARLVGADGSRLPFPDRSFDVAFVADGLHHCRSPHAALTEMYRVARRAVVVIESRDSLAVRAAQWLGLSPVYEVNARLLETRRIGGVDYGPVPNHVYRWTEAEFEKTVRSYDPTMLVTFRYFHGLNLPRYARDRRRRAVLRVLAPLARTIARAAPRQANAFAMVAIKPEPPSGRVPWLAAGSAGLRLRDDVTTVASAFALQRRLRPRRRRRAYVALR